MRFARSSPLILVRLSGCGNLQGRSAGRSGRPDSPGRPRPPRNSAVQGRVPPSPVTAASLRGPALRSSATSTPPGSPTTGILERTRRCSQSGRTGSCITSRATTLYTSQPARTSVAWPATRPLGARTPWRRPLDEPGRRGLRVVPRRLRAVARFPHDASVAADCGRTAEGNVRFRQHQELGRSGFASAPAATSGHSSARGLLSRDVNHDLIAAGHPRLNFELSAFPRQYAAPLE